MIASNQYTHLACYDWVYPLIAHQAKREAPLFSKGHLKIFTQDVLLGIPASNHN